MNPSGILQPHGDPHELGFLRAASVWSPARSCARWCARWKAERAGTHRTRGDFGLWAMSA
jgi:hypothetical protein